MDARRSRFASQFTRLFAVGAAVLLLAGCDVKVVNRTPTTFSENPSQTYTITAEIQLRNGVVRPGSLKPNIVIDGQLYPMHQSELGKNLWEYDYKLPPGRTEGAYYVLATYETETDGRVNQRESFTELQHFKVVNRYSLSLDASRAPVGAQVTVLGRGFTAQDVVFVGDQPAQTSSRTGNSISFTVPALPSGKNYHVTVGAPGSGGLDVGTLRIDSGALSVTPSALTLTTGQKLPLVFRLPAVAPAGGLTLDVTTDIPASVIMPEVTIPAGAQTVNVVVQGGQPGSGSLYIAAPGFGELTVPITVSAR